MLDIRHWLSFSGGSRRVLSLAHCEGEGLLKCPAKWISALVPHRSILFFFSSLPVFDDFCSDDSGAVRDGLSISLLASIRSHKQQSLRRIWLVWSRTREAEAIDVPSESKTSLVPKKKLHEIIWRHERGSLCNSSKPQEMNQSDSRWVKLIRNDKERFVIDNNPESF